MFSNVLCSSREDNIAQRKKYTRRKFGIVVLKQVAEQKRRAIGLELRPVDDVLMLFGRHPRLVLHELVGRIEVLVGEHGLRHGYVGARARGRVALHRVHVLIEAGEELGGVRLGVGVVVRVVEERREGRVARLVKGARQQCMVDDDDNHRDNERYPEPISHHFNAFTTHTYIQHVRCFYKYTPRMQILYITHKKRVRRKAPMCCCASC